MSLDIALQDDIWEANVTYNLGPMWRKAGIDLDSMEGKAAEDVLPILEAAVAAMEADPDEFKKLDPPNKWGDYDGLLEVLKNWAAACRTHPHTIVRFYG